MSDWSQRPDALERDFDFKDFAEAMAFVNRVAGVAEELNHHPDILVHGWNKVRLTLSTHSAGGLTDADHALARRIDGLAGG
ncbi:MAG TPA: 4a-hydroxytetrahydrobiopterin dehydratase [Solirubrobacteraceae bacterium]|nr:4a-hydroxytetrahydrobiopterin dehydratase [Solirubrobacteraceae bacterium]